MRNFAAVTGSTSSIFRPETERRQNEVSGLKLYGLTGPLTLFPRGQAPERMLKRRCARGKVFAPAGRP
jgi:hypothetical protein